MVFVGLLGLNEDIAAVSFCGWYRLLGSASQARTLFALGNNYNTNELLLIYFPGNLHVHAGSITSEYHITNIYLEEDVWYHICYTYDSNNGEIKVYVDNKVLFLHTKVTGEPIRSTNSLVCNTQEMDGYADNPSFDVRQAYTGYQAQFYLYTRILDDAEIAEVYAGTISDDYLFSYEDFVTAETFNAQDSGLNLTTFVETHHGKSSFGISSLSIYIYIDVVSEHHCSCFLSFHFMTSICIDIMIARL